MVYDTFIFDSRFPLIGLDTLCFSGDKSRGPFLYFLGSYNGRVNVSEYFSVFIAMRRLGLGYHPFTIFQRSAPYQFFIHNELH